ncbi:hypothetical protein EON81_14495 [bacterium]|nr:MAG: hypothetical protein EON81_14495 [bacterium]
MKNFTKAGIVALAAAFAGVAAAQTNGPTGISARVGVQFPRVGDTVFAAGLDYKFSNFSVDQARPGYLSYLGLSADYYGKSNRYNIPLAVTYNIRANQVVFSAGIGLDIYKRGGGGNSDTSLGGQVGIAYEFGQSDTNTNAKPIFVQAKYFFTKDSDLGGLGLYLGVRF